MKTLKTTWHNIRRSPYQAIAAIFIIFQTFLLVSIFTFVGLISAKTISYFESLPQVDVFFKNEAKQEDIDSLRKQLEGTGQVKKIHFVSKEEALKIYREQNKSDPLLLELVTANTLPSSFRISAIDVKDLSKIAETLKSSSIVDQIIYPKDVVSRLIAWTDALRKIGMVLIGFLAVDSIAIMVIILSVKISQKRMDIEIMRLIGATSWYIRWPFIFEGIFYGIVGALVGWAIASGILLYATPFLTSFLQGIPIFPISAIFFLELLGVEIFFAIFLGVFSSFLAVLRYLK